MHECRAVELQHRGADDVDGPCPVGLGRAAHARDRDRITAAQARGAGDSDLDLVSIGGAAIHHIGDGQRVVARCHADACHKLKVCTANARANREIFDGAALQPPAERLINLGMHLVGDLLHVAAIACRRTATC